MSSSTGVGAYPHYLKNGLNGDVDLNTKARETPEQKERRLLLSGLLRTTTKVIETTTEVVDTTTDLVFGTDEEVAPADTETLEKFIEELYNPMLDAKCFNDVYDPPSPWKHELYRDYKKIFEWGLANPQESPLFAESSGVSSNRFPSMCLRMVFHDNTINNDLDAAEYVASKISKTGEWMGPDLLMESSGGDASVLVCKPERYHPNQNYDSTASRILHAFQSWEAYPKGPGIGNGKSLMSKYRMSYADALHNCALAAIQYMTETDGSVDLSFDISDSELEEVNHLYHQYTFGRKDACYVTDRIDMVFSADGLGANSRRPLCGESDILPGVTLSAKGVLDWFESRGMPVGVWLSLFGTHTALDNFSDPEKIRFFGLPEGDYFKDFVGCPFHKLLPPVTEPEDTGCEWTPICKKSSNTKEEEWFLVQSDCAMGIDIIQDSKDPELELLEEQMLIYIDHPGAWIPDIICALSHLGGDDADCVGPYGITAPQKSKFGSFFKNDYPVPTSLTCDYKCPHNSQKAEGVVCLQSFDDCVCDSGYIVDPSTGNTCTVNSSGDSSDSTD